MPQGYLSINEVAEQLGVDYKTIYRLVRKGELAAAKIGGVYRIRPADVEAYVEQQIERTRQEAVSLEAERSVARCDRCLRILRGDREIAGECESAGCDNVVCSECWSDGHHFCRLHEPTPAEKLARARQARADGQIPALVTALEARRRELNFRDRFDRKVRALRGLPAPATGRMLAVKSWDAAHTAFDEAVRLAHMLGQERPEPAALHRLPANVRSRYTIPGGRGQPALMLEARVLSHLDCHVSDGFDTAPFGADELLDKLQEYIAVADGAGAIVVVGLAATTGWDSEAVEIVRGRSRGEGWANQKVWPFLIDLETREVFFSSAAERLEDYLELFRLPLPEEEVRAAEKYIRDSLSRYSSPALSAEEIQNTLGVSSGAVLTAFQRLVASGGFLIEDVEGGRVIASL